MREGKGVLTVFAVMVAMLTGVGPGAAASAAAETPDLSWAGTGASLALKRGGTILWQYDYGKDEPKPHVHPLALPGGTVLTGLRPKDHPWHLGGWFSWKYINGRLYWETDRKTGKAPGRTEIAGVTVEAGKDFGATFALDLRYHPWGEPAVLTEKRSIGISPPDADGGYHIDWTGTFTAGEQDVLLDRTPLPHEKGGKPWGGYAGLSLRLAAETRGWTFLDSEGRRYCRQMGKGAKTMHGLAARWIDYAGKGTHGETGGVALFDHPANLRFPSKWYVNAAMPYVSPALLFDRPYTLPAGKRMTLKYRILVHPGLLGQETLERRWRAFAGGASGRAAAP